MRLALVGGWWNWRTRCARSMISSLRLRRVSWTRCASAAGRSMFRGLGAVNLAVQAVVIRLYLAERMGSLRRISRAHVEAIRELILEGGPSDSIDLPGGWRAEREYNFLRLVNARERQADNAAFSVAIAADGITIVEAAGFKFEASTIAAADAPMPDSFSVAMFDAAKIADAGLVARNFMKRRPDSSDGHARDAEGPRRVRGSQAAACTPRALPGRHGRRYDRVAPGARARRIARSSPRPPKPHCALRRLKSPLSGYHVAWAATCVILF